MLERDCPVEQVLVRQKRAYLQRVNREASWLEQAAALGWRLVRAALRGLGYGLMLAGRGLLYVTRSDAPDVQEVPFTLPGQPLTYSTSDRY